MKRSCEIDVYLVPKQLSETRCINRLHSCVLWSIGSGWAEKCSRFVTASIWCIGRSDKSLRNRLFLLVSIVFAEDQKTQRFVEEYSSQIRAQKREKTMRMFQEGSIWLLISSDTIARGVDIPDIDVVVNYDLPFYTESYIHRAGRTARASECSERL